MGRPDRRAQQMGQYRFKVEERQEVQKRQDGAGERTRPSDPRRSPQPRHGGGGDVVEGSRISRIDSEMRAVTYDLTELTVMPGGIDTHVHIGWHFDQDGRTHHLPPEEESPQQGMLYAVKNARR